LWRALVPRAVSTRLASLKACGIYTAMMALRMCVALLPSLVSAEGAARPDRAQARLPLLRVDDSEHLATAVPQAEESVWHQLGVGPQRIFDSLTASIAEKSSKGVASMMQMREDGLKKTTRSARSVPKAENDDEKDEEKTVDEKKEDEKAENETEAVEKVEKIQDQEKALSRELEQSTEVEKRVKKADGTQDVETYEEEMAMVGLVSLGIILLANCALSSMKTTEQVGEEPVKEVEPLSPAPEDPAPSPEKAGEPAPAADQDLAESPPDEPTLASNTEGQPLLSEPPAATA